MSLFQRKIKKKGNPELNELMAYALAMAHKRGKLQTVRHPKSDNVEYVKKLVCNEWRTFIPEAEIVLKRFERHGFKFQKQG